MGPESFLDRFALLLVNWSHVVGLLFVRDDDSNPGIQKSSRDLACRFLHLLMQIEFHEYNIWEHILVLREIVHEKDIKVINFPVAQ